MTFKETMANLFSASEGAYYKWKRENRPIIQLIDRYFSKDDIQEFLETGKIRKLEVIKGFEINELEKLLFTRDNQEEQLVDFVSHNINLEKINRFASLKDFFAVDIKGFLYFFQKINEENPDLKIENAKKIALYKIQNDFFNPKLFGIIKKPEKHHQKSLFELIDKHYSNIEIFVLIKKNINLK